MLIGYCLLEPDGRAAARAGFDTVRRASSDSQKDGRRPLHLEADALKFLGCERVFTDIEDDRRAERAGLRAAVEFVRTGDELMVPSLEHLGHDLDSVVLQVTRLSERGVTVRLAGAAPDMMIPSGEALAFACRALALLASPAVPHAEGGNGDSPRRRGRPQALSAKDIAKARRLLAGGSTVPDVARALGVSPATVYRIFPRRGRKSAPSEDAARRTPDSQD